MVIDDILQWSTGLHEWQRDALRRVCSKDELDPTDIEELMAQIKRRAGFDIDAPVSAPLGKSHLGDSASNSNLCLKEIKKEILGKLKAENKDILFVVDDRQQVVNMWRDNGITCLQCDKGDF